MQFLLCILQYLLIAVILLAIGGCGAFLGIRLRKKKDSKAAKEEQR